MLIRFLLVVVPHVDGGFSIVMEGVPLSFILTPPSHPLLYHLSPYALYIRVTQKALHPTRGELA